MSRFIAFIKAILFPKNITTSTTTTRKTLAPTGMAKKYAVCVALNDYKGTSNDLNGCVNDGNDWAKLVRNDYGFEDVVIILDKQALKANVISKLKKIIKKLTSIDTIVFTYSGHGTSVRDTNGDEDDGRDEALCLYDGYLIDDEIRAIFSKVPQGAKLIFISDSCHSGTVSRAFLSTMGNDSYYSKPKYLPPEDDVEALALEGAPSKRAIGYPEESMNHILLTGTDAATYSYDAIINGRYNGAFTYYAIKALKEHPNMTYKQWHKKIREKLPSDRWPQNPQLEGPESLKNSKVFS